MKRAILFFVFASLVGCALVLQGDYVWDGPKYAELLIDSNAENWRVEAEISLLPENCKGFKDSGYIYNDALSRVEGFSGVLQRYNPLAPAENLSILKKIPSGQPVQVRLFAHASDGRGTFRCGPPAVKFVPVENDQYQVFFDLKDRACGINVGILGDKSEKIDFERVYCPKRLF